MCMEEKNGIIQAQRGYTEDKSGYSGFLKSLCDLQRLLIDAVTHNKSIARAFEFLRNELDAESLHMINLRETREACFEGKINYFCYDESVMNDDIPGEWIRCNDSYINDLKRNKIILFDEDNKLDSKIVSDWKFMGKFHNGIMLPTALSDGYLLGVIVLGNLNTINYDKYFLHDVMISFDAAFEHLKMLELNKKQIGELAEAKKEAEEASVVKSQFLANMSHEIRTPMNAVIGMAEIAMREDLPKKAEESILQIKASGEHLLSIINDILDFSKLESGKLEIINDNYRMITLLNDVENIIQPRMRKKNINFKIEIDPKIPEVLWGDEKRIRQILLNFVNNSIKFTNEGSITVRVIILERHTNIITLRFEVEDTGSGIKQEDLDRLFDAFEQVDKLQHRNVEGTGLGLSISRLLIQLMNGKIGVESEYGKGSTFHIELSQPIINALPCGEYRYLAPVERKEEQICFVAPHARVLLVDDTEMNIVVEKGLLAPYNMQIDVAYDGIQALKKVKSDTHYDIIFMDHMMPEMDGVEATKNIRNLEGEYYQKVPIIALTANAIKSAQELFKEAGMNDFVAKPVEFKEVTRVLLTWLPKEFVEPSSPQALADDMDWNEEIQQLSELLDITVVKKYFSGKMDVYMRALRKFIKDGITRNEKIRAAYDNSDWKNYAIYVHSMKSSCATVGAFEISSMAESLEVAAKAESVDYIKTHTQRALGYLESLIAALKESVIKEDKDNVSDDTDDFEPIDEVTLKGYLGELKDAVYTAKISNAEDIIEKMNLYGYNGKSLKEFTEKIKVMIDDFLLDDAISAIEHFPVQGISLD